MTEARKNAAARWFAEGLAHQQAGRLVEAQPCYERGLSLDPGNPDALFLLGQTLFGQGDTDLGERKMRAAISARPQAGNYRAGLAISLFNSGRFELAVREFSVAVKSMPDSVALWRGLALSAAQTGDVKTAFAAATEWMRQLPDDSDAERLRNTAGARLACEEGVGLAAGGRIDAAIAAYERALQFDPRALSIRLNLANLQAQAGYSDIARRHYEALLAAHPDSAAASFNFAMLHLDEGRRLDAIRLLQASVQLDPQNGLYAAHLLFQKMHLCLWDGLEQLSQCVIEAIGENAADIPPFIVLSMPGTTPHLQRRCAENHSDRLLCQEILPAYSRQGPRRDGRWRVGYLSSDFKSHATAFLMVEMLEAHDRDQFEIFGLSYGVDDQTPMRQRVIASVEHFIDLAGVPSADAVERIGGLDLDVLIDLKGYTEGNHSEWLQYRLAPVQINWLGFPGTLGAPWVDYLLADSVVAPKAHQWMFSERLLHLPGIYQPNCRERECGPVPRRTDEGLPEDALVLCSFNQTYKITPEMFSVWLEILRAVPRAVLWLWASNPWAETELRRVAASSGVAPERLVFAEGRIQASHLARLPLADLALDTYPCNGHTTTSDALWSGVPVVTLRGEALAARVASSLLEASGLGELVAGSLAEYRQIILAYCDDTDQRLRLQKVAAGFRTQSALCDGPRFAAQLEDLLLQLL